jgi:hypothetical protein
VTGHKKAAAAIMSWAMTARHSSQKKQKGLFFKNSMYNQSTSYYSSSSASPISCLFAFFHYVSSTCVVVSLHYPYSHNPGDEPVRDFFLVLEPITSVFFVTQMIITDTAVDQKYGEINGVIVRDDTPKSA